MGEIFFQNVYYIYARIKGEGEELMRRTVHYKRGYRIIICNRFYELVDGKKVLFYGELQHKPTVQEVWNKTVGLHSKELVTNK